tara:strand:- start:5760 stop:6056 length:297 start_codon:yes stop_codon:yes gene_type:complete
MSSTKTSTYYKKLQAHYSKDDEVTELENKAETFKSNIRIQYEELKRSYRTANNSFTEAYMDGNVSLLLEITDRMHILEDKINTIKRLMEESFSEELPE